MTNNQLIGQYKALSQLIGSDINQLLESAYQYVNGHNREQRIELHSMKIEYFTLLYSTISVLQHSIIQWEVNVALKWICMGEILGGMYVELNELTSCDSYLSSNFHSHN